jgi:hypothetical protein
VTRRLSLRVDDAFRVGRADHLASLLVQQDAQRCAVCLQRMLQIRMADANSGQPPEDRVADERKLRCRGFHAIQIANVDAVMHKITSLSSRSAIRSISFSTSWPVR